MLFQIRKDSDEFPHNQKCVAPHCRTPDEPLLDLAAGLQQFVRILILFFGLRAQDLRNELMNADCYTTDLAMRPVLGRCLSGELLGKSQEEVESLELSTEEEQEVVRKTLVVMEDHERSGHLDQSLPKRLARLYERSLVETFGAFQHIFDAERKTDAEPSLFCLHDLTADTSALKTRLDRFARQQEEQAENAARVCHQRIEAELLSAAASGRAKGVDAKILVGAGLTLSHLFHNVILSTLGERINSIMSARFRVVVDLTVSFNLLSNFNQVSNDRATFLASATHRTHMTLPFLPPFPLIPPVNPTLPLPLDLSLPPSLLKASADLYPDMQRSYIIPPRFCPVDKCSGRPLIEGNFEVVEKLLVALFSWILQTALMVVGISHDEARSVVVTCVVQLAGGSSMEVETEEEQQRLRDYLPEALAMTKAAVMESIKQEDAPLMRLFVLFRTQLVRASFFHGDRLALILMIPVHNKRTSMSMCLRSDAFPRRADDCCRNRQSSLRHRGISYAGSAHARIGRSERLVPKSCRPDPLS